MLLMRMMRRYCAVVLLASAAMSSRGEAQGERTRTEGTVLFVCEHGTVKSLLARVLFEQYAREAGLHMRAVSRGTHPDSAVAPWMTQRLTLDGVALGAWRPRALGPQDLAGASYVVSFDVPPAATAATRAPRAQWDGLPSVSQDYARGRDAIDARVHQLVDSLKREERPRRS
jgi:arsenate reductase (thioredoxin)